MNDLAQAYFRGAIAKAIRETEGAIRDTVDMANDEQNAALRDYLMKQVEALGQAIVALRGINS